MAWVAAHQPSRTRIQMCWQLHRSNCRNLWSVNVCGSTAVTSVSKAEIFAQTFSANSTLDDSGHFTHIHTPSDYFVTVIKILKSEVFHDLSGLNPRKAYGPDGVPPIALKTLPPCWHPAWRNFSTFACQLLPFLHAGSMATCDLCLRRVTVLIPPSTVLLL